MLSIFTCFGIITFVGIKADIRKKEEGGGDRCMSIIIKKK